MLVLILYELIIVIFYANGCRIVKLYGVRLLQIILGEFTSYKNASIKYTSYQID